MIGRHSHLYVTLLVISDIISLSLAYLAAFALRFYLIPGGQSPPPVAEYAAAFPIVIAVCMVACYVEGLYSPTRLTKARAVAKSGKSQLLVK